MDAAWKQKCPFFLAFLLVFDYQIVLFKWLAALKQGHISQVTFKEKAARFWKVRSIFMAYLGLILCEKTEILERQVI